MRFVILSSSKTVSDVAVVVRATNDGESKKATANFLQLIRAILLSLIQMAQPLSIWPLCNAVQINWVGLFLIFLAIHMTALCFSIVRQSSNQDNLHILLLRTAILPSS